MTNTGSPMSQSKSVNVVERIFNIETGEIRDYVYDESTSTWIPFTVAMAAAENLETIHDVSIAVDSGNSNTGTQRVTLASDDVIMNAILAAIGGVPALVKNVATGSGAISASTPAKTADWALESITIHLSAVPTTSENLTITLDATDGAEYDTVLMSIDLSAYSQQDVSYQPDATLNLVAGDVVTVAYTNTDAATYGVRFITRNA